MPYRLFMLATDRNILHFVPIVQIYTSNIHCHYAFSFMTKWVYFYSDEENAEDAYQDIEPYVEQCNAENSIQNVVSIYETND